MSDRRGPRDRRGWVQIDRRPAGNGVSIADDGTNLGGGAVDAAN